MAEREDATHLELTMHQEDHKLDDTMNMEESMAYMDLEDVQPGKIVEGKVVQISNDGVLVDVGAKSEGIIHLSDLSYRRVEHPGDIVQVGQTISVYVLGYEGEEGALRLSKRRADEAGAWDRLEALRDSQETIEAPVVEVVKGGLVVDVGLRGFIPASHISRGYVTEMDPFVGQVVPVRVLEVDRSRRRAVLSRKVAMEADANAKRETLWKDIAEGQVRTGIVKNLTDFGAFVDLGGIDGLLHISEMSWGRISHPSEVLTAGQEIQVKVLRLEPERNKISLGLRQVMPNPWDVAQDHYHVDALYQGKVVRLASFGAFVEMEPGIDGLVHISQLSANHIQQPNEAVHVGDEIWVKVLSVDPQNKRIALSKKLADETLQKA
ncbi:MAG: 30S ribosomal protein S1, partial [Firmicutes bacterium]|nr:30S ribosomal protein S1 [Bacillota bacterium]